jgi:hypothetical protein
MLRWLLVAAVLSACADEPLKGECNELRAKVTQERPSPCYLARDPGGLDAACPLVLGSGNNQCTASSSPDVIYFDFTQTIDGTDGLVTHYTSDVAGICTFRPCLAPPG